MKTASNNRVDFLIIGAQKAGTTSLFKWLSAHPRIYMPAQKEVEFFHDDKKFAKGAEWYLKEFFNETGSKTIKGEASTHYMMYSCVPERIHSVFPDVKLIAVLRNPIDRAYSHYRMAVRRGVESCSFEDSLLKAIRRGKVTDSKVDHNREYVLFGEYGRILQNYLKFFDRSQLEVVFTEDMLKDPVLVVELTYRFLGVKDDFVPNNISKRYHVSGECRMPGLTEWVERRVRWLRRQKFARVLIWKLNFDAFTFWIETQFNVKPAETSGPSSKARSLLVNHYANDVALLENLIQAKVPWEEFRGLKRNFVR